MAAAAAHKMPFVGLTGGLGSGKSTALALLQELGAATLSADQVVHDLYAGDDIRSALIERWGEEVAPGGVVDRTAVAKRVFGNPQELDWLERLLWPVVAAAADDFRAQARRREPPPRAVIVEVPLLFEAGAADRYDATVAIVAPDERRAHWAAARGHEAVAERDARQLSQQDKAARADHVIRNDGSIEELRKQLADLLDKLEEAG